MQIKVDKKALLDALTLSKGSTDRDNPVNMVYESVLFTPAPRGFQVTATDGSIWCKALVKAEVLGSTPTMIKSSQLVDIVSGLNDGDVDITWDGVRARLKSGRYVAEFGVSDAMEFPAAPKIDGVQLLDVPAATLIELIQATEGSADTKPDRPYLNGINFGIFDGDLRAVAADGSRIAISRGSCKGWTGEEGSALVGTAGTRLARQWASLAASRPIGEIVHIGFQDGWGFCLGEDAMIAGVLPDQRFPDWERADAFPKPADKRRVVRFDRKALAKAVKRVAAIGARMKNPAAIDIELDEFGELRLESHASSGKSARDRLEGQLVDKAFPAPVRRRIGADLLFQALSTLKSSDVCLIMTANGRHPVGVSQLWKETGDMFAEVWCMPRS